MSSKDKEINCYTYGEVNTANGQLLSFSCSPDDVSSVKDFISTKVRGIDIPTTGRTNVQHGGYGCYTRFNINQHRYAGGGPGFIEVLEIFNPPEDRKGFVIYEYHYGKSRYSEWVSLDDAISAFDSYWSSGKGVEIFPELIGFIRRVECGALSPWFYAVGDEVLVGDYAFPEGLQDDPVYRFGVKVIFSGTDGVPSIKTCMGTRFVEVEKRGYQSGKEVYRLVYFNDGSVWDERNYYPHWSSKGEYPKPKLITEDELWVVEAVENFQKLLNGDLSEFSINFTDGNKFVGKFVKSDPKIPCAEGDYELVVNYKGISVPAVGWVKDFVPSIKTPDIISLVNEKSKEKGKVVDRVEIKESKIKSGGKKWSGVYYSR